MPLDRRHLLGYTAASGAVATAGVLASRSLNPPAGPHNLPVGAGVTRQRYEATGQHQSGIVTSTPAAHRFIALDLLRATDRAALVRLMRVWTGSIKALMGGRPTPGDAARDMAQEAVSLTVTVGFGPKIFTLDGLADKTPAGFQEIPPMDHDKLNPTWCGGDLLLIVQADDETTVSYASRRLLVDAVPFAAQRWVQDGSWRGVDAAGNAVTGRNHFGQLDGTANPTDEARGQAVWCSDGWCAGGSQVVIRRIEMDLDLWDTATRDRQEESTGRALETGAPLTGSLEHDVPDLDATEQGRPVIALDAHVRRAHPSQNRGRTMLRRSVNYTHTNDAGQTTFGQVFVAYTHNLAENFIPVQQQLDQSDALNEWTTAIGSAVFVIPPGFDEGGYVGESLLG